MRRRRRSTFSVRQSSGARRRRCRPAWRTPASRNVGRELHGGGRWYFDGEMADVVVTNAVLSGKATGQPAKAERFDGKTTWRELAVPKMDKTVSVAAWIKIAGTSQEANYIVSKGEWNQAYSLGLSNGRLRWAINGTFVQTEQPLENGQVAVCGRHVRWPADVRVCGRRAEGQPGRRRGGRRVGSRARRTTLPGRWPRGGGGVAGDRRGRSGV